MASNLNSGDIDEERRLKEENMFLLRELKLSELNEVEEATAREELKIYDDFERQVQTLDGTDKQKIDECEWEVKDLEEQITKADKELDQMQNNLDNAEQVQNSHANELKILTDAFASVTNERETVQHELQQIREEQYLLTVEEDRLKSLVIEQKQILMNETAKMTEIEQQIAILDNQKRLFQEQLQKLNEILKPNETSL
ncbi:unnamed protein product, partial [Adineta ricciae]